MFRHPSYYKKLRERNKSDQVISPRAATAGTGVHPGPGHKRQARGSLILKKVSRTFDRGALPR